MSQIQNDEIIVSAQPTKPKIIRKVKKQTIVKEQPIEEQPNEEQPIEEQPNEEQPIKEQPNEEQPIEEQPIEDELAELNRKEEEIAIKKKQLLLKQQFKSKTFKTGFIDFTINDLRKMNDRFQKDIENKTNLIKMYKQNIIDAEEEIDDAEKAIEINIDKIAIIKNIDVETDFETEIKEQDLDDEIRDYVLHLEEQTEAVAKQIKKPSVKKPSKTIKKDDDVSSVSSNDRSVLISKAMAERKEQWKNINEGTKFIMTYKNSGLIYTKIGNKLVGDEDGKEYNSLNDVIKKYKAEIGDSKSFSSAWSLFKIVE